MVKAFLCTISHRRDSAGRYYYPLMDSLGSTIAVGDGLGEYRCDAFREVIFDDFYRDFS